MLEAIDYHQFNLGLKYSLIYDEENVRDFFHKIAPPLGPSEVYFLSLSARNKYLTPEEREFYALGRTEMFARSIVRNQEVDRFVRTVRKYECAVGGYTTKNGKNIPEKCIIVYFNVNPSNAIRAYQEFTSRMTEIAMGSVHNVMQGRNVSVDDMSKFTKLDVELMNSFQRSKGTKHYVDIDFDIGKDPDHVGLVFDFVDELRKESHNKIQYAVIDTKGGFHVLLKTKTINFNYIEIVNEFNVLAKDTIKTEGVTVEVIPNENLMIPLPGTRQGGYPVKLSTHNIVQED